MHFDLWSLIAAGSECIALFAVCTAILRKQLLPQMPVFFTLCLVQGGITAFLIAARSHYVLYFWTYWYSRIAIDALQLFLIGELLRAIPGIKTVSVRTREVFGLVAVLLAGGSWLISSQSPGTYGQRSIAWVTLMNRSTTITWTTFAIVALLSVSVLGFGWSVRWSRIGVGYMAGLLAHMSLAYALTNHSSNIRVAASYAEEFTTAAVAVYWLSAMLRSESTTRLSDDQIAKIRERLQETFPVRTLGKGPRNA